MRTWTWVLQTLDFLRKSTVETTTARAVPPSCQWSGWLWKAWQIICTQRTAMWWGLLRCTGDHLYSCWCGGIPLRVGKGPGDRKGSLPCVWGMMLPLPWVLSELKAKNIWEWLMAEDINPFLLVVLLSFIFLYLSPFSSSSFPFSSSFSSLYAVFSLLFSLIFLSLLPDTLKVTFEMRVTHTLRYKCSKGTLCCRRHWWNSVDLNTSVLRHSPYLCPWGARLNPFIWNCYLLSFWDFFFWYHLPSSLMPFDLFSH